MSNFSFITETKSNFTFEIMCLNQKERNLQPKTKVFGIVCCYSIKNNANNLLSKISKDCFGSRTYFRLITNPE